jgi:hypothetical protein
MKTKSRIVLICLFGFPLFLASCQSKVKEDTEALHETTDNKVSQVGTLSATQGNAPSVGAMCPRVIQIRHHAESDGINTLNSIFLKNNSLIVSTAVTKNTSCT